MNLSTEVWLTIITALGAGLTGAVGKLWAWVAVQLKECRDDRVTLYGEIKGLNGTVSEIHHKMGRMEGRLQYLDENAATDSRVRRLEERQG